MKKNDPKPQSPDKSETSRRRFLKTGAAAAGGNNQGG